MFHWSVFKKSRKCIAREFLITYTKFSTKFSTYLLVRPQVLGYGTHPSVPVLVLKKTKSCTRVLGFGFLIRFIPLKNRHILAVFENMHVSLVNFQKKAESLGLSSSSRSYLYLCYPVWYRYFSTGTGTSLGILSQITSNSILIF